MLRMSHRKLLGAGKTLHGGDEPHDKMVMRLKRRVGLTRPIREFIVQCSLSSKEFRQGASPPGRPM